MKILVIGQGGREHALVRATQAEFAYPGNAGIAQDAQILKAASTKELFSEIQKNKVDLVIIGPEAELVAGLSDQLRALDVSVFGPSQEAAQLEGSKIYSKEFMNEYKIPTARAVVVDSFSSTLQAAEKFSPPYVLKADGLAAGKGVFICKSLDELKDAAEKLFVKKVLGAAGARALIEEFLPGPEVSVLVMTNGSKYEVLPFSRDHKRLLDNDEGPNTGGMGVVAPVELDNNLVDTIKSQIIEPSLIGIRDRNFLYRGILFIGLVLTERGPLVLEYNVRFGDPETQAVLPLLEGCWRDVLAAVARGDWPNFQWSKNKNVTCVVVAAEGYPDNPIKGVPIEGDTFYEGEDGYILHAGTALSASDTVVVNGGRVLNAVGIGESLLSAREAAYSMTKKVSWPGCQYRRDIGLRA